MFRLCLTECVFEGRLPCMNALLRFFCLLAVLMWGFHKLPAAPAATNEPTGFQLTVELSDGSRIIGKSGDDALKFRSDVLGEMKLPLERVRSVECQAKTNAAKLTTSSGDTLAVQFAMKEIRVEAAFASVKLPVNLVRRVRVSPLGAAGKTRAGLVALWSGEGDGVDSVGGHDAVVPGGITYVPGKVGQCFNFDGRPNRITVPDAPALDFGPNQDFSIGAWISPLPASATTGVMSVVDKRNAPNNIQCQGYEFNLVDGRVHCRLADSLEGNGSDWGPAGPDLRDGNFHYITLTVMRSSNTGGHLYVDGQVVLEFDPTSVPGDLSTTVPLRIGNHPDPAYHSFFKGRIDEVAIYNRALSTAEVQAICTGDK
jgi:hypothetical protein